MENTLNLKDMLGLQSMQSIQNAITALQTEISAERRSRERADESREIAMQEMQTMFQTELKAERRTRERAEEKREIAMQEMLAAKQTELMAERRARERAEERELEMREILSKIQNQKLEDNRALELADVKFVDFSTNSSTRSEKNFHGAMMAGMAMMLFDGMGLEERCALVHAVTSQSHPVNVRQLNPEVNCIIREKEIMEYLQEINVFLLNASTITLVKLIITAILPIVTVILWKRLRPPEGRATSKAREMIHVRSSDEEDEDDQSLGLVGQLKSAEFRKMEEKLSEEQREQENEVQKQQLAAIFELLKKQQEDLKAETITEDDFNAQVKLYR